MAKKQTTLLTLLLEAREEEARATERRESIEAELFEVLKPQLTKTEGQESMEMFGYSVTVNQPMNWKLDSDKYYSLASQLPEHLQFHRTKLELDKKKYNSIIEMKDNSEIKKFIKKIQDCVTIKPGKVTVKVERVN